MKTFNLKALAIIAALGLVLPALTYADYMHVKYNTAKNAACVIKYQYYDGDNNRVTCEYTDSSARNASDNWVDFTNSSCEVRHVDNGDSQIYVSVLSKNNCVTGTGSNSEPVKVGGIGAVKTAGKDQGSDATAFKPVEAYTNGKSVKDYLDGAISNGNFSKLDIQSMSRDGVNLRVKINTDSKYKRTYFLD